MSEIECTYLVLGGTADVVVALGTCESVELDLEGPTRLLRLSEFRGRGVPKSRKKSEKVDQNRKFFDFSKVVKMSNLGVWSIVSTKKSGVFAKKIKFNSDLG